ncbi:MAG TPA: S8 family serine peptidase [Acidimicrobiales bacterium]|nr:S8 family serine peptidase [Acidimicrobiales bacterium]
MPARRRHHRRPVALAAAVGLLIAAASPAGASNDKYFDQQWNLTQIGAPAAWQQSTGKGVVIGVVDTGVDAGHPDLAGKIDAMADCVGGTCKEGTARDGEGHGTAVAGIAAARTDNGDGIAGVAPDAHLVVARALGDRGTGDTEDINKAIAWVVDHGARVVNLSLGDPELAIVSRLGTPLRPGIEYAWSRGAIPVLAAGNYDGLSGSGSANYGDLDAVVVGATAKSGTVAGYSTSLGNAKWGLVAPGGSGDGPGADVISPMPGGRYAWVAGTSMATPHVAGALALLLAQGLDPSAAVKRLLATLDRTSCGSGCQGRLNVAAAVAPAAPAAAVGPAATAAAPFAEDTSLSPGLVALAFVLAAGAATATLRTWWWRVHTVA